MKNKFLLAFVLSSFLCGSITHAGNMGASVKLWQPVIGLGGGISSSYNLGRVQTFPILNPITDEFYIYSNQHRAQTKGLFEAFLGFEHLLYSNWLLQAGLAYDQAGSFKTNGTLTQGADEPSSNQYHYQFKTVTRQVLAQAKLMHPYRNTFYPYMLLGLGGSINSSSEFSTSVPQFLTFTREYRHNTSRSFAFRVGAGIDVAVAPQVRLGIGYRFAGLGKLSLGSASIDGIHVAGTLSQPNLYANEVLIQLTSII